jgi:hypothetical protein
MSTQNPNPNRTAQPSPSLFAAPNPSRTSRTATTTTVSGTATNQEVEPLTAQTNQPTHPASPTQPRSPRCRASPAQSPADMPGRARCGADRPSHLDNQPRRRSSAHNHRARDQRKQLRQNFAKINVNPGGCAGSPHPFPGGGPEAILPRRADGNRRKPWSAQPVDNCHPDECERKGHSC